MSRGIFKLDSRERVVVFIDGQAFHRDARDNEFYIDFKKLFAAIQEDSNYVTEYNYYTQRRDKDPNNPRPFSLQQLLDWLAFNGVRVTSKERDKDDPRTDAESWPDFVVDLTVDAMLAEKYADHFIFFTSNEAYLPLFKHLRGCHKRITLVATNGGQPIQGSGQTKRRIVPAELRKAVHSFIDVETLKPYIENTQSKNVVQAA